MVEPRVHSESLRKRRMPVTVRASRCVVEMGVRQPLDLRHIVHLTSIRVFQKLLICYRLGTLSFHQPSRDGGRIRPRHGHSDQSPVYYSVGGISEPPDSAIAAPNQVEVVRTAAAAPDHQSPDTRLPIESEAECARQIFLKILKSFMVGVSWYPTFELSKSVKKSGHSVMLNDFPLGVNFNSYVSNEMLTI